MMLPATLLALVEVALAALLLLRNDAGAACSSGSALVTKALHYFAEADGGRDRD